MLDAGLADFSLEPWTAWPAVVHGLVADTSMALFDIDDVAVPNMRHRRVRLAKEAMHKLANEKRTSIPASPAQVWAAAPKDQ